MSIKKVLLGFSIGVVIVGSSIMLIVEEPTPAPITKEVILVQEEDIISGLKEEDAFFPQKEEEDLIEITVLEKEVIEQEIEPKPKPKPEKIKEVASVPTRGGIARLTNYAPLDPTAVEGMDYSGDPNETATGSQVHARTAAVDPAKIPFGTLLRVKGRIYVAADTGGAMRNYHGIHIDLFNSSRADAYKFGVQEGKYEIVGEVNPLISLSEWEKYIKDNNLE